MLTAPGARRRAASGLAIVLAVTATALLWPRTSPPPPPSALSPPSVSAPGPPLAQQIVGLWKGLEAEFPHTLVFRADGTVVPVRASEDLLAPSETTTGHYRVDGDVIQIALGATTGAAADGCDRAYDVRRRAEGWMELTPRPPVESCSQASPRTGFTLVRLSPISRGGLAYPPPPVSPIYPALTTNPLHGTWLLQGSGLVLVVGRTGAAPGVGYRLDDEGALDSAPGDHGALTIDGPGRVALTSAGGRSCGPTLLRSVAAADYVLTARVEADPCDWFDGATTLTWLLVE